MRLLRRDFIKLEKNGEHIVLDFQNVFLKRNELFQKNKSRSLMVLFQHLNEYVVFFAAFNSKLR